MIISTDIDIQENFGYNIRIFRRKKGGIIGIECPVFTLSIYKL
jgi:hypothetical protein